MPTIVNVDDFGSVVSALGLPWTPDTFGFTDWDTALASIRANNGVFRTLLGMERPDLAPEAYLGSPALVAVANLYTEFHQRISGYLPTSDQAVAALGVSGTVLATNPRPANVPVSDYDWHEYAAAVLQWAPLTYQLFAAAHPEAVAPVAVATVTQTPQAQWNAAIKAGQFLTTPSGFQLPTFAITQGPTTLPDGTVYVQFRDTGGNLQVIWYNGPTYKPRTTSPSNPVIKTANDDLIQVQDKGTGDWYRCMVVYGDPVACQPPDNFPGPYTLPADIADSLSNQAGQRGAYQPTPVSTAGPDTIPAGATISPNGTVTQPQTGSLTPGGSAAGATAAAASTVTTPAPTKNGALTFVLIAFGLLLVWMIFKRNGGES